MTVKTFLHCDKCGKTGKINEFLKKAGKYICPKCKE